MQHHENKIARHSGVTRVTSGAVPWPGLRCEVRSLEKDGVHSARCPIDHERHARASSELVGDERGGVGHSDARGGDDDRDAGADRP